MTPRVDAWMRQSNSDWAVAELTAQQGFHSQACYHYGQAAEKALKALLISLDALPPYSHSLERLVDNLESTARHRPIVSMSRTATRRATLRSKCWPSPRTQSNPEHDIFTI